jgi:predicted PurR-regulated permease PerM
MVDPASDSKKAGFSQSALNALRLGALLVAVYWCYRVLDPFIPLVIWGAIIAVAAYPIHTKLSTRLGGRSKLSATLIALLGLTTLVVPIVILTGSLVTSGMDLADDISKGVVTIPPPSERVQEIPIVGEEIFSTWRLASENLVAALERFKPQLETLRATLIATAGGAGAASLQMVISIIIAGVLLAGADRSAALVRALMNGLVGKRGPVLLAESETTIRSVAQGILGVAIIESILAAIGLLVAGVPAAGLWTFLILVLSIIQIPQILFLFPFIIYVFSTAGVLGSAVFLLCSVLIILIDTFLKPVMLGRAADAPTLVVLLGAIGGMLLWGLAGLFVGAVLLVLCWGALEYWVMEDGSAVSEGN